MQNKVITEALTEALTQRIKRGTHGVLKETRQRASDDAARLQPSPVHFAAPINAGLQPSPVPAGH
ncbi:hypothetical protein N9L68_09140 [bacterium]|nr:hypothetical protein [bacterium]